MVESEEDVTYQDLYMKLKTGMVRRCHTMPSVEYQTIGHHSWGVAMILLNVHPNPSVQLLKAALQHDMSEQWLGDMPATAKWRFKSLQAAYNEAEATIESEQGLAVELTEIEQNWLKAADLLELMYWCLLNIHMGNTFYIGMFGRCRNWFDNHCVPEEIRAVIPENYAYHE